MLGCSYLYPHVLPNPHVTGMNLHPDDQLIIIANQGLWKYMSYQEAVDEVVDIPDPIEGAKKLQDLAQVEYKEPFQYFWGSKARQKSRIF